MAFANIIISKPDMKFFETFEVDKAEAYIFLLWQADNLYKCKK
jgi:hypothetical protein